MPDSRLDILMITYNRDKYTGLTLKRLLDTCDEDMRVWVWQNGDDSETIATVQSLRDHPRFYKYHHSSENKKLNAPTNWLWQNSDDDYFAKVDDDCLVPHAWANVLRKALDDVSDLGLVSCWHYPAEDFVPELAMKKVRPLPGGHRVMLNCWVGGSGYLMRRECCEKLGPLKRNQSFTNYGIRISRLGYIVGWYYPFLYQEHFDDPRSQHTQLKTDFDLQKHLPLSADAWRARTLQAWIERLRNDARYIQGAPANPKLYIGWRARVRRICKRFGVS